MRPSVTAAGLAVTAVLLAGCASTQVDLQGTPLAEPVCREDAPPRTVRLAWTTHWRPDQKEPSRREEAARRGLADFLARTPCLSVVSVERLEAGVALPDLAQARQRASDWAPPAELTVWLAVRELGPTLRVGVPVVVEGATEVKIDVRVFDARAPALLADVHTHWRHGGRFVVKGVQTLDRDLSDALTATLMTPAALR